MKNDLISVIVPIYNVEKYLERCINSIVNQTYKNLEIILVNDGSTDQSGKICDIFGKKDSRIKVIHKENGGISNARNVGLKNATGNYISFIDSDDYINEDMLMQLMLNIKNTSSDIVVCDFIRDNNGTLKYNKYSKNEFFAIDKEKFANIFNEYYYLTIVLWNKLYKKNVFNNLSFPDGKINEDEYLICEILNNAKKVSYFLKPYYYYFRRDNSIMSTFNLKRFDAIYAYEKRIEFFQKNNMKEFAIKSYIMEFSILASLISEALNYKQFSNEIKEYEQYEKKLAKKIFNNYFMNLSLKDKNKILLYLLFPKCYYKIIYKLIIK